MTTAEAIFLQGVEKFRARLTSKENTEFQTSSLLELRKKMAEIQHQQELNKSTMNMRRLERFLEGMNQLSRVVEVYLNANEIVCFIWGPIKLLLVAATQHMEALDSLLDAYKELGLVLPQIDQYGEIFGKYPDMQRLLAEVYCEILEFHRKAMRFFQPKGLARTFRALWKGFDFEFKDILRSIRFYRDAIRDQFAICSTADAQRTSLHIASNVQTCIDNNRDLRARFEQAEKHRIGDEKIKVQNWIQASNFTREHHRRFQDQRKEFEATECKQTGRWILDAKKNAPVNDWIRDKSTDHTMIWINGKKGAGKSFLASIIIDECAQQEDAVTSYFYCHENDPNQNTALAVFKGLLSQLVSSCPDLAPCAFAKSAVSSMTITSMEAKSLLELFLDRRQYIIIDGLDECELIERKQIIQFFADRLARNFAVGDSKVRAMFVSQSLMDIRKAIQAPGVSPCIIDLRPNDKFIASDISRFVDLRVKDMQRKFKKIKPEELEQIRRSCKVSECHEGMFLFAHLVTHNLLAQPRLNDLLEEANQNFPTSLSGAYENIMKRMKRELSDPPTLWVVASKLLSWMACSKRPMNWTEMQAAMSLTDCDVDYRLFAIREDATRLCGSIVHVFRGKRLEFIHSTAKDYLLNPDNRFIHHWDVEIELAIRCFDYLTFDCFAKGLGDNERRAYVKEGQYALQDYAVSKWMHHFEAAMWQLSHLESGRVGHREEELTGSLRRFVSKYGAGLGGQELKTEEQKKKAEENAAKALEDCERFRNRLFYHDLVQVWTHVRVHEGASWDIRNMISIPLLQEIVAENRKFLQKMVTTERERASGNNHDSELLEYYGRSPFKCDRVTCDFFWEGFETEKELKGHTKRHDRPYNCPVDNCGLSKFGFPSNKDRERHLKQYHPDHPEAGPSPFLQVSRRKVGEPKFTCKHCGKSFTRNINLKSHIYSHFGEKPFSCGTCGKCFARLNDCRRHEKIHARRLR